MDASTATASETTTTTSLPTTSACPATARSPSHQCCAVAIRAPSQQCYVCMEEAGACSYAICDCRDRFIHEACLQRMVMSLAAHSERCAVCKAPYRSVQMDKRTVVTAKRADMGVIGLYLLALLAFAMVWSLPVEYLNVEWYRWFVYIGPVAILIVAVFVHCLMCKATGRRACCLVEKRVTGVRIVITATAAGGAGLPGAALPIMARVRPNYNRNELLLAALYFNALVLGVIVGTIPSEVMGSKWEHLLVYLLPVCDLLTAVTIHVLMYSKGVVRPLPLTCDWACLPRFIRRGRAASGGAARPAEEVEVAAAPL